jgi:hypothetical protein
LLGLSPRVQAHADSGTHLWADRFEEDLADLFKLQDEVVARLGNALGFELVKAEAGKSVYSKNPDAIDLTMRALALLVQNLARPPNRAALASFEQALKIDLTLGNVTLVGVDPAILAAQTERWTKVPLHPSQAVFAMQTAGRAQ